MPKGRKDGIEKGEWRRNSCMWEHPRDTWLTWRVARDTLTGDFLLLLLEFSRDSFPPSPLFIAISTYRHPSSGDALPEMIRTCQDGKTYHSSTAVPPFRSMDHARIYFLEIPQEGKSARIPNSSGECIRTCSILYVFND